MNTKMIFRSVCLALSVLAASAAAAAPAKGAPAARPAAAKPAARPAAKPVAKPAAKPAARPAASRGGARGRSGLVGRRAEEHLSPEDRRLLSMVEEAHGLHELSRVFPHASRARSADVRSALVDALEEHGERAAGMIAAMIADSDEDVSESAFSAWTGILDDMSPRRRVAAIHAASQALSGGACAPQPGMVAPQPGMPMAVPPAGVPVAVPPQAVQTY